MGGGRRGLVPTPAGHSARAGRRGVHGRVGRVKIGCPRLSRGRTVDLIVGVALPVGRSKSPAMIFSPFCHPPRSNQESVVVLSPREKVHGAVARAREWLRQLNSGEMRSLSAIAAAEGISVARVSQLLVLGRVPPVQISAELAGIKRLSIRSLVGAVRKADAARRTM